MKKALKRIGLILLVIFVLLLIIPFAFQGQIRDMVKNYMNENLNAKVEFSDVNLSLIRSFPKAHVALNDLVITNYKPFEDETLVTAKSIALTMSVTELFNSGGDDPMAVNSIIIDEALLNLKTNTLGDANYDIAKSEETETETQDSTSGFSFDLKSYSINNSAISYLDEATNTTIYITELDHSGKGVFSESMSQLDTETLAYVSMTVDSTSYLKQNRIALDALIEMDSDNQKYTFKDNKAFINQLPLVFDGYVQILENGQDIHMSFENPESSFKDFLAVIPEAYSKNIADVETTGDFKVHGDINGTLSETTIPQFDITIDSENASFKYPDLPKRVNNISIHTILKNETGLAEDTYVDIKNLDFKIDEDVFQSNAVLRNITENMQVDAFIDGALNLANLSKAYPMSLDNHLSGILKAKLNTNFDMNAIETNSYSRIKNNGTATIKDFVFSSEDIVNPIQINNADISFKPGNIKLEAFDALTGTSDIKATGSIKNLLGFLLSDKSLQGNFNVNSNQFAVSDFMVEDTSASENSNKTTDDSESLKIPEFLDCTINANAKTVLYDNLTLNDVQGTLVIKDQEADLKNLTSNLFDGDLALTGKVSTKSDTPEFDLNIGAQDFDIAKSFEQLELLQNLAPVAKAIQGKLNTMISIKGNLDQEFSPVLSSVSGNAFAELFGTSLNKGETSVLSKLDGALNFIDLDKLDLKDVKTKLKFDEGKVSVEPFTVSYEDIAVEVSGSHSFDKTLDYNAVFQVPAKYLGSDVNQLLGKINDPEVNTISIPVTANITGSYTNPNIQTDLSSGVNKLTQQLIEIEKQKLINKGTDKVTDLLGGLLVGKENQNASDSTKVNTDSTKTDPLKEGVNSILGGLLKKRKKAKDSTKN
ncbi:AsmA-like C-terminal region-containing protein [Psychroserpens sp.]|uniref:AsmA-like C-terminal region-containing protein n=1 Tax=Psychroserpens sp. TaxID=2020870 RepID=UPI001B04D5E1|nr:AsmA-like C-terminal region-containing protein [Psychroserpens sp.]MBO6607886.1 AsmA-like C-terminal region-containing protein [Psychroserpens sp.]MBO6631240.1 AsmA-like C-terminal region-containing protein [Psychroserpens sp.]MBO6654987.1 AsmA-like C-terminal region-containing protein [Psychroserpens sp.]MBO6682939.1 AsmA-like C-terminal region-containing protein [Psychroserpens sp.]MBO6751244.1 AsmA-like C-terminal region-containing protein [Psychroserpens sp.]